MEPKFGDSALQSLEKFVVENDDLLALEAIIGRFNIFDSLGIARKEINHSNFLRFILDPGESHGQSEFLHALLMDLFKRAPPEVRPLSPIELDGAELRGVEVRREWNSIDLLIICREPSFVVAIENKVDSSEHSGQLGRYRETVRKHFPGMQPLFVFLTANGAEPSEPDWLLYTYADLFNVLDRTRRTYGGAIGDDVALFLQHYLKLIGTRFMNDEEIDRLCQKIWKNHRNALELIYARYGNPSSGAASEVRATIEGDPWWHVFYQSGPVVDFVPAHWLKWLPELGMDRKDEPKSWLVCRFELYERSIDYYVEVRRMEDAQLRRKIVDALIKDGERFGFVRKQARDPKGAYTRVASRERVLEFEKDEPPDSELIRPAIAKRLAQAREKMTGLDNYLQTLLKQAKAI